MLHACAINSLIYRLFILQDSSLQDLISVLCGQTNARLQYVHFSCTDFLHNQTVNVESIDSSSVMPLWLSLYWFSWSSHPMNDTVDMSYTNYMWITWKIWKYRQSFIYRSLRQFLLTQNCSKTLSLDLYQISPKSVKCWKYI